MKISLQPFDVLFFRNAKPFDAAYSPYGETMEMPYLTTVYGALRSKILSENHDSYEEFLQTDAGKLTEVIGDPEEKGSLEIDFFSLINNEGELLLPVAEDLVREKDGRDDLIPLKLKEYPEWLKSDTAYNFEYLVLPECDYKVEKPERDFMKLEDIENYLNGAENVNIENLDKSIFDREFRTGIKIDKEVNRVEEGMLYRKELLNLSEDYMYFLEIKNEKDMFEDKGMFKLGGEGKVIAYEKKELDNSVNISKETKQDIEKSGLFKIYLATPAVFEGGWLPGEAKKENTVELNNNISFEIIAASLGKHRMISGWDINKGSPKPGFRMVPAGSVFYCKVLNDKFNVEDLFSSLHGNTISDKYNKEGFGLSYLGGINNV